MLDRDLGNSMNINGFFSGRSIKEKKRETEKIEEMFDEMKEKKDDLAIKCGELERDLEFSQTQMGKLELEQGGQLF